MKVKAFVAVSLALVMLLTAAAPALAKPVTGDLYRIGDTSVTGTGTYALSVTKDNHLKVTIVLKGAAEANWEVAIFNSASTQITIGYFDTNSRGRGRFSGVTNVTFTNSDSPFTIRVYRHTGTPYYYFGADNVPVTFR